jgi:RimJ/RimL family protein N-acetyltransferase
MASKLKQPTFETERLRLRPFRKSDATALHSLYVNVENLRYWGTDPSPDLASTRKMLRWHISFHPFHYAL